MNSKCLTELVICIKGAGELASGVAWRLHRSHFRRIVMLETPQPMAVRRTVSFCEAVILGEIRVEGVTAIRADGVEEARQAWRAGRIAVIADPEWRFMALLQPDVLVDAVVAKRNLGTRIGDANLVIGLGPGFAAGKDAHRVVETNRGHNLGRVIASGRAEPNTGIPGVIGGYGAERVLKAPADGAFTACRRIGEMVQPEDRVGDVAGVPVSAAIAGVLRGLIRSGATVGKGRKVGDVDPRGRAEHCHTISDKARAVAGGVLEAILERFNG